MTSRAPSAAMAAAWLAIAWMVAVWLAWLIVGWRLVPGTWWFPVEFPDGAPFEQLRALLGAACVALACAGWGVMALRVTGLWAIADGRARVLLGALLGSAVGALVVFGLGVAGLLWVGMVVFFGGAAGLAWAGRGAWGTEGTKGTEGTQREAEQGGAALDSRRGFGKAEWALFVGVAVLGLLPGLAPVVESDGLRYHVFAPQEYLKAGAIVAIPHNAFTNLPSQLQMLYLPAMWIGNPRATQLIHGLHLPLLMLATGLVAERLARSLDGRTAARRAFFVAAALVGTMPVVLVLAGWPFVDLASATFLMSALYCLVGATPRRIEGRALLGGFLAGGAMAVKLSALTTVAPLAFVPMVLASMRGRGAKAFALFVFGASLLPAPWLVRNLVNHGNPVYPAAYSILGGSEWSAEADAFYKSKAGSKGFGKTPLDLILSPLDVTLRWTDARGPDDFAARETAAVEGLWWRLTTQRSPGFEDQNPGPAVLAMLVIALAGWAWRAATSRRRMMALMVLGLVGTTWLAWFVGYQSVRFLIPAAAIAIGAGAAVVGGMGAAGWTRWTQGTGSTAEANGAEDGGQGIALMVAVGLIAGSGVAWFVVYSLAVSPTRPVAAALGLLSKDEVIARRLNSYEAIAWLNIEAKPGERVIYIGEHRGLYARYPVEHSDWFDVPHIAQEMRSTPDNAAMLAAWRARGVRYVLINMAELSLYIESDFRPRLGPGEWTRFFDLMKMLDDPKARAFSPRERVFVVDLHAIQ